MFSFGLGLLVLRGARVFFFSKLVLSYMNGGCGSHVFCFVEFVSGASSSWNLVMPRMLTVIRNESTS